MSNSNSNLPSPLADILSDTTCQPCREQHLRCDRALPKCGRCLDTGRECTRAYRFKHFRRGAFSRNQRWSYVPRRLKFVLLSGTGDEIAAAEEEDEGETAASELRRHSRSEESSRSRRPSWQSVNPHGPHLHSASPPDQAVPSRQTTASGRVGGHLGSSSSHPNTRQLSVTEKTTETASPSADIADDPVRANIYLERPIWPIQHRDEAILFRHYVEKLAAWLDLCDPDAHFKTSIPSRAGTCPILLNAIFALSARNLSHTSRYDPLASNRYHEQCLNYLIPLVNDAVIVSDENLFAATIILRVLEELDVPTLGQDTHGHLLGIHAFVAPDPGPGHEVQPAQQRQQQQQEPQRRRRHRRRLEPNTLRAACFWVGLRQEIYSAVMNQQPVRMNLAHDGVVDRSTAPADDFVWANRAIVHFADVLNYCFGERGPGDVARWEELARSNENWKACLPASYTPIFYRERRGGGGEPGGGVDVFAAFPEVWYWRGCHVIAVQHHILAELYLAVFDPSHPRTGPRRRAADASLSERARNLVRNLCGIGVGNQWCPPAMFTACMGITVAGDRFESRADMEALLEVLRITEREHGRPTRSVVSQLKRCWGIE